MIDYLTESRFITIFSRKLLKLVNTEAIGHMKPKLKNHYGNCYMIDMQTIPVDGYGEGEWFLHTETAVYKTVKLGISWYSAITDKIIISDEECPDVLLDRFNELKKIPVRI